MSVIYKYRRGLCIVWNVCMACSLRTGTKLTLELKLGTKILWNRREPNQENNPSISRIQTACRPPNIWSGPHSILHQKGWIFFLIPKVLKPYGMVTSTEDLQQHVLQSNLNLSRYKQHLEAGVHFYSTYTVDLKLLNAYCNPCLAIYMNVCLSQWYLKQND